MAAVETKLRATSYSAVTRLIFYSVPEAEQVHCSTWLGVHLMVSMSNELLSEKDVGGTTLYTCYLILRTTEERLPVSQPAPEANG